MSIDKELVSKIITEYVTVGNLDSIPDCFEKEYFLNLMNKILSEAPVMSDEDINKFESQLELADNLEKIKIITHIIDTYPVIPDRMKEILRKQREILNTIKQNNKNDLIDGQF